MKFQICVSQIIEVEMDAAKFDDKFMKEFRETMYPFKSLNEHACHIAQLFARGLITDNDFIEGYGLAKDMGIKLESVPGSQEEEVHGKEP